MALIDVVKWNATPNLPNLPDLLAWKFPSEELATTTQLIVAESQEAVLVRGGQMLGPFRAGRHTLSTENIPVLSAFVKIPFGGRSPFSAEVWFVNKAITLDVKWGTSSPLQVLDPKFQVMLPVTAFGQFGVTVEQTKKFLVKLVGTLPSFDREQLKSYFKGVMLTRAKDCIAKKITKDGISILEISAHLNDISKFLQDEMAAEFSEFGLKLVRFFVNSISAPEDDAAVVNLKDILNENARTRLGGQAESERLKALGTSYQQERSFDAVQTAAGNPGAGGVMGAGIGLGMGVPVGHAMGAAMGALVPAVQTAPSQAVSLVCPKCRAQNVSTARFCSSCASPLSAESAAPMELTLVCDKCGTRAPKGAKFCPNCADPFILCPKCGTDNPAGLSACRACGSPMPMKCGSCGTDAPPASKFCLTCGKPLVAMCTKCDVVIPPTAKFCPGCGAPRV